MIRLLAVALLGILPALAPAADDEATVRAAIAALVPNPEIESVTKSPIPGLYEVVVRGQLVYVTADGKHLVQGSIVDVATREDLTEASRAIKRRQVLAGVGKDMRIAYAPKDPRYTLTVFTDIDCGYCRRMHQQMDEYNERGIAVEYLFFPRAGVGSESFDKAVSVWCAEDRAKALTDAKNGVALDRKECTNPIEREYALGQRVGVTGTPAVYAPDGTQLGGYLPPDQMLQRLKQLEAN